MTITTRAAKGAPLTNAELDANFTDLRDLKAPLASPAHTGGMSLSAPANAYFEMAGNNNVVGTASMLYGQDTTSLGYIWNRANAAIAFGTNGLERMRLMAAGNLLIGTTTDNGTDKLQVNGSATINGRTYITGAFGGAASASITNTSANSYSFIQMVGTGATGGGQVAFFAGATATGGVYGDTTGLSLYTSSASIGFKLLANGNILAGAVTDSGQHLQVIGPATSGGVAKWQAGTDGIRGAGYLYSDGGGAGVADLSNGIGNGMYWSTANNYVTLQTVGLERLRVDPQGVIGVGVTPATAWGAGGWAGGTIQKRLGSWMSHPSAGAEYFMSNSYFDGTNFRYLSAGGAALYTYGADGGFQWSVAASGAAAAVATFAERMRISVGGNLLINTSVDNGADRLQVNGPVSATGAFKKTNTAGVSSQFLSVAGSTTATAYGNFTNTGASVSLGIESSAGGTIFVGASPYAGVYGTANSTSLQFAVNNAVQMTIDPAGNFLFGSTGSTWSGVGGRGLIELNGASQALIGLRIAGASAGYMYHDNTDMHLFSQKAGALRFYTNAAEGMRIDASGNLLVGTTSGGLHTIKKAAAEGAGVLILSATPGDLAAFYSVGGFGWNAAAAGMIIGKNASTSRSINAAGTVNASGADYAEYMRKADTCGDIAKGQVVGINAAGLLTDKWDEAVSFMVKTTNPSYVGGDTWGTEEALGIAKPTDPEHETYAEDLAAHEAALEAARAKVDRIAFAGQVPVNVYGTQPGCFIIPMQVGSGIGGMVVPEEFLTMQQYIKAVGIVQNILPDGRANIRVKVA